MIYFCNTIQDSIAFEKRKVKEKKRQHKQYSSSYTMDTTLHLKNQHNELDFFFLFDRDYSMIENICIDSGTLTAVKNIPEKVKVFKCINNSLHTFPLFFDNIISIDVSFNHLSTIDLSSLHSLKTFIAKNNELTSVDNFPSSIEYINVNNNRIKNIYLENLHNLKVVNCINNISIVLHKVPKITKVYISSYVIDQNDPDEDIDTSLLNNNILFTDALLLYFQLKAKYDERKTMTMNENTCIKCNKVGTNEFIKEKNIYWAKCNCKISCFEIRLDTANKSMGNIEDDYYFYLQKISSLQNDIQSIQLQHSFEYLSHEKSIELFMIKNKEYQDTVSIFEEKKNLFTALYMNDSVEKDRSHLIRDVQKIRTDGGNVDYSSIQSLLYDTMYVDITKNKDHYISKLVQERISYERKFVSNIPLVTHYFFATE